MILSINKYFIHARFSISHFLLETLLWELKLLINYLIFMIYHSTYWYTQNIIDLQEIPLQGWWIFQGFSNVWRFYQEIHWPKMGWFIPSYSLFGSLSFLGIKLVSSWFSIPDVYLVSVLVYWFYLACVWSSPHAEIAVIETFGYDTCRARARFSFRFVCAWVPFRELCHCFEHWNI